jgi:Cu+-exporting ATPase
VQVSTSRLPLLCVLILIPISLSSCTSTITSLLLGLTNVVSASVNLTFSSAEVIHDSSAISAEAIRDAIESVGYGAEIVESSPIRKRRRQAVFGIEGMTCTYVICHSFVEYGY